MDGAKDGGGGFRHKLFAGVFIQAPFPVLVTRKTRLVGRSVRKFVKERGIVLLRALERFTGRHGHAVGNRAVARCTALVFNRGTKGHARHRNLACVNGVELPPFQRRKLGRFLALLRVVNTVKTPTVENAFARGLVLGETREEKGQALVEFVLANPPLAFGLADLRGGDKTRVTPPTRIAGHGENRQVDKARESVALPGIGKRVVEAEKVLEPRAFPLSGGSDGIKKAGLNGGGGGGDRFHGEENSKSGKESKDKIE